MKVLDAPIRELDLLRGLAITMMVVNHAGVRLADPSVVESGLLSALIFLGSCAPVVFFFTTGVGGALSRRSGDRWADLLSVTWKALLLLVADQLAFWATGRAWGLDFLGFIGISSVCVAVVAGCRRPLMLGALLIAILVVLRYVVGPLFAPSFDHPGLGAWFIGTSAVRNVSYPVSPWLIYPLLGLILATHYVKGAQDPAAVRRWAWRALAASAVFFLLAFLLYLRGTVFYRWGVVSSGFFVMSFGVVFALAAAAILMKTRWPATVRVLGLRGGASLAVVPIHMALIEVASSTAGPHSLGAWVFTGVAACLVATSMGLSVIYAKAVERKVGTIALVLACSALSLAVLACVAMAWSALPDHTSYSVAVVTVGQLAVAALMVFRKDRRARNGPAMQPEPA